MKNYEVSKEQLESLWSELEVCLLSLGRVLPMVLDMLSAVDDCDERRKKIKLIYVADETSTKNL